MKTEIAYKLERLATETIVLPPHFTEPRLMFEDPSPYFREMRMVLITHVASRELGEKELQFYPPRQSFWDYILRRKPKAFRVKVSAKDILKDIPQVPRTHDVIRMYEFEEINISDY